MGLAFRGYDVAAVARPLDNPKLDHYVNQIRHTKNLRIIPRKKALKESIRLLRKNGVLGLVMDQNQARGGAFIPFFNKSASTATGAHYLNRKTGAPVFFGWDLRRPDGKHEVHFSREIPFSDDLYTNILQINRFLENLIKKRPELYFWMHPRWKKRPPGETGIYKKQ